MTAKPFFRILISAALLLGNVCHADNTIQVYKRGVLHKFIRHDPPTDRFTELVFQNWENETFEVFDQVKDDQAIAIDLGAWIGTTSIWLSKNFHHVIAVDGDRESLACLQKNLDASECRNVTICGQPISNLSQEVIFGTNGGVPLNQSISLIKTEKESEIDYSIRTITLKKLLYDYVYTNPELNSRKVGFIKCDIEGGEENILEDVLHFAYHNKCKVFMSFHLDWWKSKNINDFAYLFKYFNTNCPASDICGYLSQNTFASILFEPKEDAGLLVKSNITALIVGYNQLTYIRDMVNQLEKYTSDIVVVDNASDFPPLLEYYENDFKYTLLKQKTNRGHIVYLDDFLQKLVGNPYLLTDPDLTFNPNLPDNFISQLIEISENLRFYKVGFALCIDAEDLRTDISFVGFERGYWTRPIVYPQNQKSELYHAPIDSTFCLINKRYPDDFDPKIGWNHCRVAGDFTCIHRPWHKNFQNALHPGEYEHYLQNNKTSNYFRLIEDPA